MNYVRSARASGCFIVIAGLFVVGAAASCDTSNSVGALRDGGRADGNSGTGGNGTGSATGGVMGTGGAQGTGGGLGTGGGTGSGGAWGTGGVFGTGGRIGTGGVFGTGGRAGTGGLTGSGGSVDAALDAHVCVITDVYCPYGYVLDVYGCSVCALGGTGGGGGNGSGGGKGSGGGNGGGGSPGTGGAGPALDAAQDGVVVCGSATCAAGEYCCSAACNWCAPKGYSCIQSCGEDAGQAVDSNGCRAVPSNDSTRCGGSLPPHYYTCDLTMLAAPCTILSIGDIVNTFCCP